MKDGRLPFSLKQQLNLTHITSVRSDSSLQYPYFPIIATMSLQAVYLAGKLKDNIVIHVCSAEEITKSYSLKTEKVLPTRLAITALQFLKVEEPKYLYLLIGYSLGQLFLIKCLDKQVNIIRKFNQSLVKQSSLLSKTFSFFQSIDLTQYSTWQKTSVIKICTRKSEVSYLLRNSMIVVMSSIQTNMQELQKKYDDISKITTHTSGLYQNAVYQKNINWTLVKQHENLILKMKSSVSSYYIDSSKIAVATFDGQLLLFDRANLCCYETVRIGIAIKNVLCYQKLIVLALQDDCVQIIDLSKDLFLNLVGHKSFTNQVAIYEEKILISSFDGNLSHTKLPPMEKWGKLLHDNDKHPNTEFSEKICHLIDDFHKIGKGESGLGNFIIESNILVCCMLDNYVKFYKITP